MSNEPTTPKGLSEGDLVKAALNYLKSYETTESHLRTVLTRRVRRKLRGTSLEEAQFSPVIDAAVRYCLDRKYVDDQRYAELFIESARRRSMSRRKIEGKLREKGLSPDDYQELVEDSDGSDLEAAVTFARKKRIGPFRIGDHDQYRQKDMAKLARQGFDFDVCCRVMEGKFDHEN
ncbi:hypothetical protein AYJ57_21810 (plasmid) [Salipiger sp. CCB-MM3]|uniref:regulatory protein RecX n=1 Tax=Salipiger sp. CCB-MM3 TaxID=1792508 RepID=UPI00080A98EF|nr:regulatory protein RecX [Salipiger sp. CCB-MM3]ANT63108.1 hypothetical protein AYJ57_21810 [Salipiger sp. CCB-MM3]